MIKKSLFENIWIEFRLPPFFQYLFLKIMAKTFILFSINIYRIKSRKKAFAEQIAVKW